MKLFESTLFLKADNIQSAGVTIHEGICFSRYHRVFTLSIYTRRRSGLYLISHSSGAVSLSVPSVPPAHPPFNPSVASATISGSQLPQAAASSGFTAGLFHRHVLNVSDDEEKLLLSEPQVKPTLFFISLNVNTHVYLQKNKQICES